MSDDTDQSPFTRPAFISAAIIVGLIVVLGAVLGIRAMTKDNPGAAAAPASSAPPASSASPTSTAATEASVCGLPGVVMTDTLSKAPVGVWAYEGSVAYPTSPTYGPAKTNADGVHYCFQHSPAGAVFAAANGAVQGSDAATAKPWLDYFVAAGAYRDTVLNSGGSGASSSAVRLTIVGFRLLSYDGTTARVDIACRGLGSGTAVLVSGIYPLRWEDGDWKLSLTSASELNIVAQIPDLAGYVSWGA